jgi:WS/DGAT/MGAT family acyltransferase
MTDQLSPIESIMWRVGQDPVLRMTVGALLVLDKPLSVDVLVERLRHVTNQAPLLHRRPEAAAGRLRPLWIDEEDPSPEQHVRSFSVAHPGAMRQVLDLVSVLESVPFDPERSPWDISLITGLHDGRAALYLRAHHVLTDGLGGMRLLALLLDEATWPRVAVAPASPKAPAPAPQTNHDRPLGVVTVTIDVPKAVRRFFDGFSAARDIDPVDSGVRSVQRALDVANSVSRQLVVTGGPLSNRSTTRSMLSRFEVFSVEGARAAALGLGGSRNDLLVAAAAAGLGRYYERQGEPSLELRVATPTSQRRHDDIGGNWFAPTRVEVPTAVGRPGPQFGVVVERLSQARREPALRLASALATTIGWLPSRLLHSALHAQADSVDFAATAVPGLRVPRHICGSRIVTSYPLGPRLGCPMNITAFGNEDRLDVGIALDPSVLDDPDLLIQCLTEAFGTFATGPSVSRRGTRAAK